MKRVLVVDDEVYLQVILRDVLTPLGYEVETASDGQEGLTIFQKNPHDLVITDIVMPNVDGLQFVLELKKISPELKIIVISGGAVNVDGDTYLQISKDFGADLIIKKPFLKNELIEGVISMIGKA